MEPIIVDNVTVAWVTALATIIGGFISLLVTIMLFQQAGIKKQLGEIYNKLDKKLDEDDHEKQAITCVENIRSAFNATFQRLDEKIITTEKKLCSHYHNQSGDISYRTGGI